MADSTVLLDKRRRDQRSNIRSNPFWISSSLLTFAGLAKCQAAFSFPPKMGSVWVHHGLFQLTVAWNGTTPLLTIGSGTIATDAAVDGDTVTVVGSGTYWAAADITEATPGWYSWLAALAAVGGVKIMAPSTDATVPIVYLDFTVASGTPTTGAGYIHLLVSKLDQL